MEKKNDYINNDFKFDNIIKKILKDPVKFGNNIEIDELEKILRKLASIYYNTGDSIVPDNIYDTLEEILKNRDPNNSFLNEIGSLPPKDRKVNIPYLMTSINKKKTDKELSLWMKKYDGPYILSDKLDGASALIVKKNGEFKMYSRGNEKIGQDITHLLPYVLGKNVKKDKIPDEYAIRGELIISKINFDKIKNMDSIIKKKNPRNLVAGLINSKKINIELAKLTDFVAYAILNPLFNQSKQFELLNKYSFNVVNNWKVDKKDLSIEYLSEQLKNHRKQNKYEIDGIIIIDDSQSYPLKDENPDHAIAFKTELDDQLVDTIVLDVIWKLQRDGHFSVKILIKPVELLGSTIEKVTAKNAKFVFENKIGPGAIVKIVKSGDIIPNIAKVIKPAPNGPKMPNTPYKWNKTGVSIYAIDIISDQQNIIDIQKMVYFFETVGIKYISEGIITKLVNAGYNDIFKFFKAKDEDILNIEGIGETLLEKIKNNIEITMKKVKLNVLMAASYCFDRGLGKQKIKLIINKYPNIMNDIWNNTKKEKELLKEKIIEINGFADKTANQFVEGFNNFKIFFNKLNKIIDLKHILKLENNNNNIDINNKLFINEKIVFTGFDDKNMVVFIEQNGGEVKSSVSGKTTLLIYKDNNQVENNSNFIKAKKLGIKMISDTEFKKKYMK